MDVHVLIKHLATHHLGLFPEKAYCTGDVGERSVLLFHQQLEGAKDERSTPTQRPPPTHLLSATPQHERLTD
jgi:hypothetical protein